MLRIERLLLIQYDPCGLAPRPLGVAVLSAARPLAFPPTRACRLCGDKPGMYTYHGVTHAMNDLVYALKRLAETHREGSYATQAHRKAMRKRMGTQLVEAGYKRLGLRDLKGRHVHALLKRWAQDGLSTRTQKNRLATLRWWAQQSNNPGAVRPGNTI
jgi:hypothetical protein